MSNVHLELDKEFMETLTILAKEENKSINAMAKELLVCAMEDKEDRLLSLLANIYDVPEEERLKHSDVRSVFD